MATEVDEELARLRTTNADLLQTKKTLQAKVETLQAENATLQTQATEATQKAHDALIGVPLKHMAAQLSEFPALWLCEFEKRYSVEADSEGNLTILTKDGKPANDANGKPVEFAVNAIWKMLTGGAGSYAKTEDAKLFATLTKWQGPSGAGSRGNGTGANIGLEEKKPKAPKLPTGLLGLH